MVIIPEEVGDLFGEYSETLTFLQQIGLFYENDQSAAECE